MKLLPWLTKISPQKAFDNISRGVDKLAFTKEERADLNMKLSDKVAAFAEKTLSENTIRSKARRVISYCIVFSYLGLLITSIFVKDEYVRGLVEDSALQTAFIMVLAFFYTGYYLGKVDINKKKD